MPSSHNWSSASATCRIDWKPSVVACIALIAFGVLAVFALLASDLPRAIAWPAAPIALAWGCWLARREWLLVPIPLVWRADGVLFVGGERVAHPRLQWRGPLAFLDWRDGNGHRRRLAWWPDTLAAAQRRELRLAAVAAEAARNRGRVAP